MNRFLLRLFFVAIMLCDFLGSGAGVRVQGITANGEQKNEEHIKQNDGYINQVAEEPRTPVEAALRSAPSSHRVVSSRPTRLLPTHGGKSGHHHSRWTSDGFSNPFKYALLQLCYSHVRLSTIAASPRFYYVIALRRLLC